MKEYKKLVRRYRRELKKIVRHVRPTDYRHGLELLFKHIEFMHAYYTLKGVEVPTKSLQQALDFWQLYLDTWKDLPPLTPERVEDLRMQEYENWNIFWEYLSKNMLDW